MNYKEQMVTKEPIHFEIEELPIGMQLTIIGKFNFKTYCNFCRCSRKSNGTCEQLTKSKFRHDLNCIYVRRKNLIAETYSTKRIYHICIQWQPIQASRARPKVEVVQVESDLTIERCRKNMKLFQQSGTTCNLVLFRAGIKCGVEMLQEFIEILHCKELQIDQLVFTKNEILQLPAVKKLRSIYIYNSAATDGELLELMAGHIEINSDHITNGVSACEILAIYWFNLAQLLDLEMHPTLFSEQTRHFIGLMRPIEIPFSIPLDRLDLIPITYSVARINPNSKKPETLVIKIYDGSVIADVQDKMEEEEPVFIDFGLCAFNSQFPAVKEKREDFPEADESASFLEKDIFKFEELPMVLRRNIIRKFDFSTYAYLCKSSRNSRRTCDQLAKQRYRHDLYCLNVTEKQIYTEEYSYAKEIHIQKYWHHYQRSKVKLYLHLILIHCPLTKKRCRKLIGLFRQNGPTCSSLAIRQSITCEPEMLQELIEVLECADVHIEDTVFVKNDILQFHSVRELNRVYFCNCAATDRELLGLKGRYITINSDRITSKGIAKFIQQWRLGKRDVHTLWLQFDETAGTRTGDMVLGTDATLLWSPETHKESYLSDFPLEYLQGVLATYLIKRITPNSDEPETLMMNRQDEHVHLSSEDAYQYLKQHVEPEIFYEAKRECLYCETEFCEHFNRFSVGRFRRAFPMISKYIAFSAMIAKFSIYPLQVLHLPTTFNVAYLRTVSRPYFYIE